MKIKNARLFIFMGLAINSAYLYDNNIVIHILIISHKELYLQSFAASVMGMIPEFQRAWVGRGRTPGPSPLYGGLGSWSFARRRDAQFYG